MGRLVAFYIFVHLLLHRPLSFGRRQVVLTQEADRFKPSVDGFLLPYLVRSSQYCKYTVTLAVIPTEYRVYF